MPSKTSKAMQDVYRAPGHLFRRMQQIAVGIFMEECGAALDLTPVQFAALVAVRDYPGIDATRLSALIAFDRSTLGNVLERLELKELIARQPIPNDKRIKLLHLTAKGQRLLAKAIPLVDHAQERIMEPLGAVDRKVMMELLGQLVHLNNDVSRAPMRIDETGPRKQPTIRRRRTKG